MKELSIEEKAKRYDEALEKSKRLYEQGTITESLCYVFPELKESEDERIRKAMIDFFKHEREEGITVLHYGVNIECMIAWLEKQREQKPAAWSEEDKVKINRIVACLENLNVADNDILLKDVAWLKSLRPQNRWKPSDEQMITLRQVISGCSYDIEPLVEIEEYLKKLKG